MSDNFLVIFRIRPRGAHVRKSRALRAVPGVQDTPQPDGHVASAAAAIPELGTQLSGGWDARKRKTGGSGLVLMLGGWRRLRTLSACYVYAAKRSLSGCTFVGSTFFEFPAFTSTTDVLIRTPAVLLFSCSFLVVPSFVRGVLRVLCFGGFRASQRRDRPRFSPVCPRLGVLFSFV